MTLKLPKFAELVGNWVHVPSMGPAFSLSTSLHLSSEKNVIFETACTHCRKGAEANKATLKYFMLFTTLHNKSKNTRLRNEVL